MKTVLLYLFLGIFACSCSIFKKEGLSQKQKKYNKNFCKKGKEKIKIYKWAMVEERLFRSKVIEIDSDGDGVMDLLATVDKGRFKGLSEKKLPCTAVVLKMPNVGHVRHALSKKQVCMFDIQNFDIEGESRLFQKHK